jgi:hypothetical protein
MNEGPSRRAGAFQDLSLEIESGRGCGLVIPANQLLDQLGPPDVRLDQRHWVYLYSRFGNKDWFAMAELDAAGNLQRMYWNDVTASQINLSPPATEPSAAR